jgi:hypothetical protein
MVFYSVVLAAVVVTLALRGSATVRAVAVPFIGGAMSPNLKVHAKYLIEIVAFLALFSLTMLAYEPSAHAQTITVNSLTASPTTAAPGQTIVFTATMTANQNASSYPVEFSLNPAGVAASKNTVFFETFQAGKPVALTYSWTVPAGTTLGIASLGLAVYNSAWHVPALAQTSIKFVVAAAAAPAAQVAPVDSAPPVISGTAQVGKVLASTTGTWTGATSYAYKWAGNGTAIAGATASTYTLAASDAGHTLTSTVTATGSGGAASATSAATVPIVAAASSSSSTSTSTSTSSGTSGSFVALHTYYISPTGNDSNSGTSTATAWRTPKHNVVCGDVIIAAAGNYGGSSSPFGSGNWGAVSSCPSTAGGIDGTGGVYFATLLCAGPYVTSCPVSTTSSEAVRVDASNWAVEGFSATSTASACFTATSETTTTLHHVAFINDIASKCYSGGFVTYPWNATAASSFDQTAMVGVIAYNASPDASLCVSGISVIPTNGPDSSAGTHVFVAGAFSYANIDGVGCSGAGKTTDGEGLIFDSWGLQRYTHQGVVEQSAFWGNGSAGLEIFPNGGTDGASNYVFNVTSYGNLRDPYHADNNTGEFHLTGLNAGSSSIKSITNSIGQATVAIPAGSSSSTCGGSGLGCPVFAATLGGGGSPADVIVNSSYFKGVSTVCVNGGTCDSGHNVIAWNGNSYGTNTYSSPGLASPGSLPSGAPNCSGYASVTACMNTGYGVAADLTPSGGAVGKGYQAPGPCNADAYYPTWLKGVVYLTASGSTLTANTGLVTQPCGM